MYVLAKEDNAVSFFRLTSLDVTKMSNMYVHILSCNYYDRVLGYWGINHMFSLFSLFFPPFFVLVKILLYNRLKNLYYTYDMLKKSIILCSKKECGQSAWVVALFA